MTSAQNLRAYTSIISVNYRALIQYRTAAVMGFATQLFWGAIKIMVLGAFYLSAISEPPMSFAAVISYIWLGQALFSILPWRVDPEIEAAIRSGGVAYELVRPLDLYFYWFCRTVAFRTAPTLLRASPMIVFATFIMPLIGLEQWALQAPASLASFILFLLSLISALLISISFTMLLHVALVYTLEANGFNRIAMPLTNILSGLMIPLPLFPDILQPILYWQPFRGLIDVPLRIYSGDIAANVALGEIALQLTWVVAMIWFGRWALNKSLRRVVAQGG